MEKSYTPLNIEKLKKQYFTKKSNKLDMILILLGALTIVVQGVLLFVLVQKKATTSEDTKVTQPAAVSTTVAPSPAPSLTPVASTAAALEPSQKATPSGKIISPTVTPLKSVTPSVAVSKTP